MCLIEVVNATSPDETKKIPDQVSACHNRLLRVYEGSTPERFAQWQMTKEQMIAFLLKETEPMQPKHKARM